MAKFRPVKGIGDYTDYLTLSASNSASLSYTGGNFIMTTANFDAVTGEKIADTREYLKVSQIKNKISGSRVVEQQASSSLEGLERVYKDMTAKLP
jgi:hypothetical protein